MLSFGSLVIIYGLFILIILFHEIGHATASYKFSITPKEIGFGFYFIFPVFYTDVTNIWRLSKRRRNVVNVAGIYFQLLLNVILILLYHFNFFKVFSFTLILVNSISIFTSLIPFFRYDGYWLFSDYFDIPNLQVKAKGYILKSLLRFPKKVSWSSPLFIYSLLNLLFWAYVYFSIWQYITSSLLNLNYFIATNILSLSAISLKGIVNSAIFLSVIYLLLLQIINTSKFLYYESGRIFRKKRAVN